MPDDHYLPWFEALYREMYRPLYRHLHNRLHSPSNSDPLLDVIEDCIQETFEVLWKQRRQMYDSTSARAWLYTVAGRRFTDRLRAHAKEKSRRDEGADMDAAHAGNQREEEARNQSIDDLLIKVAAIVGDEKLQEILSYYESMNNSPTGGNHSADALRMRVYRTIWKLRKIFLLTLMIALFLSRTLRHIDRR